VDPGGIVALIVGVLVGLLVGWYLWRRNAMTRQESTNSEARSEGLQRRLLEVEADRVEATADLNRVKDALRAERSLLDGVASQSGVAPRRFRQALAREYLHIADPYRASYLSDEIDVEERSAASVDLVAAQRASPHSSLGPEEQAGLRAELAAKQQLLDETRADIHELGVRVTRYIERVGDAPRRATELQDEVAYLRGRLADRAIESNRIEREIGRDDDLVDRLDDVISELVRLRDKTQHS
jgi:hypothetical protein